MPSDSSISVDAIWLASLRASGRSPKTVQSYAYCVAQLRAWRTSDPDLTSVTRFEALAFVKHLGERYQPGGVALRVRSLRAMYSWLLTEAMVESNPFARIKSSITPEAKPAASDDQIEAMLQHAKRSRRDYALLVLLTDSGARRRELAALTVADLDLASGMVRFPVSKSMIRTVPLTDRAVAALGRWLRARGTGAGSLWSSKAPYELVNAVCLRHSKGALRAHALRRVSDTAQNAQRAVSGAKRFVWRGRSRRVPQQAGGIVSATADGRARGLCPLARVPVAAG